MSPIIRAYELARMIGDSNISATEVLEAYLAAITKHNPNLNAIIATLNENQARLRAQEADEALSRRTLGTPARCRHHR